MLWEIFVLMNKWRRQKCFPEGKLEGLKIKDESREHSVVRGAYHLG